MCKSSYALLCHSTQNTQITKLLKLNWAKDGHNKFAWKLHFLELLYLCVRKLEISNDTSIDLVVRDELNVHVSGCRFEKSVCWRSATTVSPTVCLNVRGICVVTIQYLKHKTISISKNKKNKNCIIIKKLFYWNNIQFFF